MSWADIYLTCFLVGFLLSAASFLLGSVHLHLPHMPHFHGPVHGHFHGPVGHAGAHAPAHAPGHGGSGSARSRADASYFNFGTITGFLAWFGGVGYLLERYSTLGFALAMLISIVAGLGGGAVIYLFLAKVILPNSKFMEDADYEMIGVLGTVTSRVRTGGTGEMIFVRDGGRRVAYVRSETGEEIDKGEEVVITRFEKGIAYVRRWEELANAADSRS